MSDTVEVPFEGKSAEKATLLLAAAEELDLPADVVKVQGGQFVVPAEVEKKAFGSRKSDSGDKQPAKKAAAKKSESKDKE